MLFGQETIYSEIIFAKKKNIGYKGEGYRGELNLFQFPEHWCDIVRNSFIYVPCIIYLHCMSDKSGREDSLLGGGNLGIYLPNIL